MSVTRTARYPSPARTGARVGQGEAATVGACCGEACATRWAAAQCVVLAREQACCRRRGRSASGCGAFQIRGRVPAATRPPAMRLPACTAPHPHLAAAGRGRRRSSRRRRGGATHGARTGTRAPPGGAGSASGTGAGTTRCACAGVRAGRRAGRGESLAHSHPTGPCGTHSEQWSVSHTHTHTHTQRRGRARPARGHRQPQGRDPRRHNGRQANRACGMA